MINFNTKDDNMREIAKASKLYGFETKHEYRIYGLQQDGNPPVLFSAQENVITSEHEKTLQSWLKTNKIESAIEDCISTDKKVYIGLRRDLRDNIELCAGLIQTVVNFVEGRLEIPVDYKFADVGVYN